MNFLFFAGTTLPAFLFVRRLLPETKGRSFVRRLLPETKGRSLEEIEQELLRHVMEGLRLSTTWQVRGPDASRKLSTLRFVTGSFQRHLERLRTALEHLMHAHAEGLPALARGASVQRLAEHMIDISRMLTIVDLWLDEEDERE